MENPKVDDDEVKRILRLEHNQKRQQSANKETLNYNKYSCKIIIACLTDLFGDVTFETIAALEDPIV